MSQLSPANAEPFKRNRRFWALVKMWTSMCPWSISVRCAGSIAKLRIPSMGYPEIFYFAIKLFIELITFMWWQKIIEEGPSCSVMTKKTSLSQLSWWWLFWALGPCQVACQVASRLDLKYDFPSSFAEEAVYMFSCVLIIMAGRLPIGGWIIIL